VLYRQPLAVEQIGQLKTVTDHPARWRDSPSICALADPERHLGHVVKAGTCWLAFDATHFDGTHTGFRFFGSWMSKASTKQAVEQVVKGHFGGAISTTPTVLGNIKSV
jgi:hypothetical protein